MKRANKIRAVHRILKNEYGDFEHHNKKNPLNELVFILCSVKTNLRNYSRIYRLLKNRYPTFASLSRAKIIDIEKTIRLGGLSKQRSRAIKDIMSELEKRYGRPTLNPLRKLSDENCERELRSLPRVGKKVARCVMLYSLDRKVFPVDTHCWRICLRLGWITPGTKNGVCMDQDMDKLQALIPSDLRRSLHVNLISHGRKICTPKKPRCIRCSIRKYCPSLILD